MDSSLREEVLNKVLNQVLLVGKIDSEIHYGTNDDGSRRISIDLLVSATDSKENNDEIIPLILSGKIAFISSDHLKVGMTIGVKASLRVKDNLIVVKVDKLTFITTGEDNNS